MNTPLPEPSSNPSYGSLFFGLAGGIDRLLAEGKFSGAVQTVGLAGRLADADAPKPQPYNDHDVEMQLYNTGSQS